MKMKIAERNRIYGVLLFVTVGILFPGGILEAVECVFKDPQYSFQCLRSMGYSSTGGGGYR